MEARNTASRMDAARRRWKAVSASPAFLIAALVLGVALMFGAPLLLAEQESTSGRQPAEHAAPVAQDADGEAATHGTGEPEAAEESDTVHPPRW